MRPRDCCQSLCHCLWSDECAGSSLLHGGAVSPTVVCRSPELATHAIRARKTAVAQLQAESVLINGGEDESALSCSGYRLDDGHSDVALFESLPQHQGMSRIVHEVPKGKILVLLLISC